MDRGVGSAGPVASRSGWRSTHGRRFPGPGCPHVDKGEGGHQRFEEQRGNGWSSKSAAWVHQSFATCSICKQQPAAPASASGSRSKLAGAAVKDTPRYAWGSLAARSILEQQAPSAASAAGTT